MKAPGHISHQNTAASRWLAALLVYLGLIFAGNLLWEIFQLPLYTIWSTGSAGELAFAVGHCILGDLLIATSALVLALLTFGDVRWPAASFWKVAAATLVLGVGYTVFSEWLNVVVRESWAYSEAMPIIKLFGIHIGVAPLLQWMVIPGAAFKIMRGLTQRREPCTS